MSYVGDPFKHDIFVSYTHADPDGSGESLHKVWSRSFAEALEQEMRSVPRMAQSFKIFLDQDLRPGQGVDPMAPLSDQLRSEIGVSAIIAVLISPHYLQSSWCALEREWWREEQVRLNIPFDERMAIARIWPLAPPDDQWPEMFVDTRGEPLVGFWFYDRKCAEIESRPFDWPQVRKNEPGPFRSALLHMVGAIRLKLNELKAKLDEHARMRAEAEKLVATGQVVYLHGRESDRTEWEKARDLLQAQGFAVLPDAPDPLDDDPFREQTLKRARIRTLGACDALLLLGSADGRAMDDDLLIIGRQDRHSARAVSKRLLPCALIDRVPAAISTAQRRNNARALQVDWIDAAGDDWVEAVKRWLAGKSATLSASA